MAIFGFADKKQVTLWEVLEGIGRENFNCAAIDLRVLDSTETGAKGVFPDYAERNFRLFWWERLFRPGDEPRKIHQKSGLKLVFLTYFLGSKKTRATYEKERTK